MSFGPNATSSVASRFLFRWKANDLSTPAVDRQVHAWTHAENTHISSSFAHMLITGDSNRGGMRCRAIIRMLTHMLITTLQLGTEKKKKKKAPSRVFAAFFFFFITCALYFFELELFTQLKSILAGCTFTFVSKALLFVCLHLVLLVAVIRGSEDAGKERASVIRRGFLFNLQPRFRFRSIHLCLDDDGLSLNMH